MKKILVMCCLLSACAHASVEDIPAMPIGDEVTGHSSEVKFCKREPDQCDKEDDGGL